MTTKYGIRHYPKIGAFLAFKDTTLFGVVIRRSWLSPDGSVCLSKEGVIESIRNNFSTHKQEYVDEYVYKQEWWDYSDDYLPQHLGVLLGKIVKDARGGPLSLRVDEV